MQNAEQRNAPYPIPGRNGLIRFLHHHGADLGVAMNTAADYIGNEIWEIHKTLPADISLKDREKAIRQAYPGKWAPSYARKAWQIARYDYLRKFGYVKRKVGRPPKQQARLI